MLCQIFGLLVMDSDGGRIAVKYTPGTQHAEFKDYLSQTKFETQLMQRSQRLAGRTDVEVVMVGDVLALFRSINDVCIFVLAEPDENAFVLLEVANEMSTVLNNITSGQVGKRQLFEHLDEVFLMLDEIVDGGVIFEVDANMTTSRIRMVEGGEGVPEPTAFNAVSILICV
eukprot:GHVN01065266.1.p1 GENE.GHVN01065266.1~~GHVN01065266.1.p1  ORF type:complete len:171 (+),score=20.92 GHVN01065266.1:36-548(+)